MESKGSARFIDKMAFVGIVLAAMIQYKSRRRGTGFWHWLYSRVTDKSSWSYNSYWLIQYLLVDAINKDDDAMIAAIPKYLWEPAKIDEARIDRLERMKRAANRCELVELERSIDALIEHRRGSRARSVQV